MAHLNEVELKGKDNYLDDISHEVRDLEGEIRGSSKSSAGKTRDGAKETKEKKGSGPETINVINRACSIGTKTGIYRGSWLTGGEKNFNNPGDGKGHFDSNDGKVVLDGQWGKNGELLSKSGKLTLNGEKEYKIGTVYNEKNTPIKMKRMECTSSVNGFSYSCEIDSDFKVRSITYEGITLNITYEEGRTCLVNKHGNKIRVKRTDGSQYDRAKIFNENVSGYFPPIDLAIIRIAKCIAIVKGSGYELDHFEYDNVLTDSLQADYKGKFGDVDLLECTEQSTGIRNWDLVKWLNDSRGDFGI